LIETVRVPGHRNHAVVLTKDGRGLLERHRNCDQERHQTFYAGLKREREVEHRLQVYRAYEHVEARLVDRGAHIERVVLDHELNVRRDYEPRPVQRDEEVTELVGMCLWDIISDNHEVITADGRLADLRSFRGSSAFLDEYLNPDSGSWREGDAMRFYMGTLFIARTWQPCTR